MGKWNRLIRTLDRAVGRKKCFCTRDITKQLDEDGRPTAKRHKRGDIIRSRTAWAFFESSRSYFCPFLICSSVNPYIICASHTDA